jgi:hypothetical protein
VHDLVRLELRGVPAVGVATEPFADEAVEQAGALGMPDVRLVYVPHPVQLLTTEALQAIADSIVRRLVAALTEPAQPAPAAVR